MLCNVKDLCAFEIVKYCNSIYFLCLKSLAKNFYKFLPTNQSRSNVTVKYDILDLRLKMQLPPCSSLFKIDTTFDLTLTSHSNRASKRNNALMLL